MAGQNGSKEKIIKEGYMIKRSQNKNFYTLVNYKKRWFVLTKTYLIYYDNNEAVSKKKLFYYLIVLWKWMIYFGLNASNFFFIDFLS